MLKKRSSSQAISMSNRIRWPVIVERGGAWAVDNYRASLFWGGGGQDVPVDKMFFKVGLVFVS